MSTTDTMTILQDNKLLDAEDYLLELGRDLKDEEVDGDLAIAAYRFVKLDTSNISFLRSLKRQQETKGTLSNPQLRAALNIMRQRLLKADLKTDYEPEGFVRSADGRYTCSDCFAHGEHFSCETWPQLRRHKQIVHGIARPYAPETEEVREGSVLAADDDTGLDLSGLPDGTYAFIDKKGANEYVFLKIRRTRRTIKRDRRYVYGKIRSGKEYVPAGTIEVREQSGDTKRLAGEQRPGATYRGEFKTELTGIMNAPDIWGKIAGLKLGHCCICSKTLTSDYKDIGVGPECIKKPNYWFDAPPDWAEREREMKARKRLATA